MSKNLRFTKMQAYGNDYVYIDTITQKIKNLNELSRKVSDRHFGIGSDGMILVCPSKTSDFKMRVFNPDGTEAEMCGNAVRSVGKFVYEKEFTDKKEITVETIGGEKRIFLTTDEDNNVKMITANIGKPILEASKVPVICSSERCVDFPIELSGRTFKATAISLGNPHCVSFVDDLDTLDLTHYGRLMETNSAFPRRVNAEFCEVIDRQNLKLRTWERGTGETLACATGCCTCVVGGVLTGRCDNKVSIHQIGGVTEIEWRTSDDCLYMTAPSEIVFDGEISLGDEFFE